MAEVVNFAWVNYIDPSHIDGSVNVWTSDQGYRQNERYVTHDVELVVRMTRCYAEYGQFYPSVSWGR